MEKIIVTILDTTSRKWIFHKSFQDVSKHSKCNVIKYSDVGKGFKTPCQY